MTSFRYNGVTKPKGFFIVGRRLGAAKKNRCKRAKRREQAPALRLTIPLFYAILKPTTRKAVKSMVMIYLLFAMSIIFIRFLSGHDSRYESGKYLTVQNTILSKLLMDNTSLYERTA